MKRYCVMFFPQDYPEWMRRGVLHYFGDRLSLYQHHRRNPRDEEYMRKLCDERFGENYTLTFAEDIDSTTVGSADEIVLLWPCGNGYGWLHVEQKIFRFKRAATTVHVLNGRKRLFRLTPRQRFTYGLRRFAERFWIGEIIISIAFYLTAPLLAAWDAAKGKR